MSLWGRGSRPARKPTDNVVLSRPERSYIINALVYITDTWEYRPDLDRIDYYIRIIEAGGAYVSNEQLNELINILNKYNK